MDNNNEQKKSISDGIVAAAKTGRLKMRPKWHFVLRAVLWLAGVVVVTMVILYFLSLLMFLARETGIWVAPIFGWHGVLVFLVSIPWMLVLAVLFFVVVLEILVRRYSFAYRLPLLYSVIGALLLVVAGGIILARTPLHGMLSHCLPAERAFSGGQFAKPSVPPCGTGLYHDLDARRFNNIHNGVIGNFFENGFVMIDRHREELLILVNKKTRLPFGEDFSLGDTVVVVGDRRGDRVEAFGISKIDR
jgi:hypothetical protein